MNMKIFKKAAIFSVPLLLTLILTPSCTEKENMDPQHPCDTIEVTYAGVVQPILEQNCYSCHANGSSRGNVTLGTYEEVVLIAQSGRLSGAINHEPGYAPMPNYAPKLDSCDIYFIDKWIDEGALDN